MISLREMNIIFSSTYPRNSNYIPEKQTDKNKIFYLINIFFLHFIELGANCEEDGHCAAPNSECVNKKCSCKNLFETVDGTCVAGKA